ncbi:hypothetical protein BCR42DRAFT_420457 [Absidia repens]|uniref:Uncharacterized protein n=1 Tax=Absidia repens TaxID=90262 RepID=A0A1X2IB71_9FUNG|nr:hypothetical protein BCR42DRAFT_420457 [Absidia repens]
MYTCTLAMNATENVRGINFRFSKLTAEYIASSGAHFKNTANYAITIEFDERYNLLHHFASPSSNSYMIDNTPAYKVANCPPPSYSAASPKIPQNSYQPSEKL